MRTLVVLILFSAIGIGCRSSRTESRPVLDEIASSPPTGAEHEPEVSESSAEIAVARDLVSGPTPSPLDEEHAVYFELDSAELTDASRALLEQVAKWLLSTPDTTLRIEGHTDTRGTSEYNLALGERRAHAIHRYLSLLGVPASRLATVSHGEERPAAAGENEQTHARNRRGELVAEDAALIGALDDPAVGR